MTRGALALLFLGAALWGGWLDVVPASPSWSRGHAYQPLGSTRQYRTTPGSLSGQTICEPGTLGPKFSPVFWHDGLEAYGPKYAGTVCITLQ